MQESSQRSIIKKATENLRLVVRDLELVGDHGTVAKLRPILERLVERRSTSKIHANQTPISDDFLNAK